ncbi:hypothetical protein FWF74_01780 [Candidatus Saccharibacteria bacterium]|nr:hypothetical protein [Candidatus Saccharibacteria bacterium]MCL1963194.1 hypothetical protein [Candidatus Saccharibacteria bacterium]
MRFLGYAQNDNIQNLIAVILKSGKIIVMGIIVKDQQERSELQQRIAAELREKQLSKDLVDKDLKSKDFDPYDSEYTKDLKPTTTLSWAWLLIALAIVGIIIAIVVVTI